MAPAQGSSLLENRKIPDAIHEGLKTCKAFALSDGNILLLSTETSNDSVIYDVRSKLCAAIRIRMGTYSREDVCLVNDRFLFAMHQMVPTAPSCYVYDIVQMKSVQWPKPALVTEQKGIAMCATRLDEILLVGGQKQDQLLSMVRHCKVASSQLAESAQWTKLPPINTPRRDAAVTRANYIMVTGGLYWNAEKQQQELCSVTEIYDGRKWNDGPRLQVARKHHSMVILEEGSVVVVIGGLRSNNRVVAEVEVWRPGLSDFVVVGKWQWARSDCSFVVVPDERSIYVFGGYSTSIDVLSFPDPLTLDTLRPLLSQDIPLHDKQSGNTTRASAPPATLDSSNTATTAKSVDSVPDPFKLPLLAPLSVPTLPCPPSLPKLPLSQTVRERHDHLRKQVEQLQQLQETYRKTIAETSDRVSNVFDQACAAATKVYDRTRDEAVQYYNRARDDAIQGYQSSRDHHLDTLQFEGAAWLSDIERRILQIQDEMKNQDTILKETSVFLSDTVKTSDLDDYADDVPSQLRCPITLAIMSDPVVAADGNAYDRAALESWFEEARSRHANNPKLSGQPFQAKSPLTGEVLESESCFPVHTLRSLCLQFAQEEKKGGGMKGSNST